MTKTITDADFQTEVLEAEGLTLVDFWAPWCGPCRMVGPVLEQIDEEISTLTVAKLNIDENPTTARDFGVMSIPTMIVFKEGKPVKTIVGAKPKAAILKDLEELL